MISCAVSNQKFFSEIEPTNDPSYGYTAENPVNIKNADLSTSIHSSYYYLSRLRSPHGNKMKVLVQYGVDNPNYRNKWSFIKNTYTGMPISNGTGLVIDLYLLKPENEVDTIRIYINPYLKGEVKIPYGLKFEKE